MAAALTLSSALGARAQSPSQAEIVASTSHAGGIIGVDISPNGHLIISGGKDGTVKLWDVASGKLIRTYVGTEGGTNLLKFRPEGDAFIAAGTGSRQPAKMLSAFSNRTLKSFPQEIPPDSVGFLRTGKALYFGSEFRWELWDLPTTKLTKSAERVYMGAPGKKSEVISNVAVFDGKAILLSSAKEFPSRLVEEGTFKLIRKYPNSEWDSACFIDNGARFIAVSTAYNEDQTTVSAYTHDTHTGQRLQKVEMPTEKSEIICLPGKGIAYLTEGAINILFGAGQRVSSRKISGDAFKPDGQLALSTDGSLAVYGSPSESRVELWSIESGRLLRTFSAPGVAATNNYRISDRITAVVAKDFVAQLDIGSGRVLSTFQNEAEITASLVLSNSLIVGDTRGRVRTIDLTSNKVVREVTLGSGEIRGLAGSSRKDRIAVLAKDFQLTLFEASNGRAITSIQLEKPEVDNVLNRGAPRIVPAVSEDEFFVTEGEFGGSVSRFSFESGKIIKTIGLSGVSDARFVVPSGAVTRNSGTGGQDSWPMQLVSLETGKPIRRIDGRPEDSVAAASVMDASIDGKTLLVGRTDASVDQIDLATGHFLRTFPGHKAGVSSVRMIALDRIASTSGDGSMNVWNSKTGSLLASTFFFSASDWLTITPEGFFDISSPKAARFLSLVRGLDVSSVDQVYNVLYRPDLVRENLAGDPGGKVKAAAAQIDLEKVMASGASPKVAVDAPAAGVSSSGSLEIHATITDRGGGIGKVEWRVNGVTLGIEERGIKRMSDAPAGLVSGLPNKTLQVSRTLGLTPGENRIAVLAYNEAGLIASEPAEVVVTSVQSEGGVKPRLYVLAVGVNDYWDGALRLNYAANDAKSLSDGLRQAGAKL
ncbi:WD40 repeat domain-containing protein, partial [Bradyrhizobium sp. 21]|uniref:WD40 repeat domain-containing protein n=1 Tax=Bradyrhizobium sp. 21 TaxID=2782666 RepID=UPI001FFB9EAF